MFRRKPAEVAGVKIDGVNLLSGLFVVIAGLFEPADDTDKIAGEAVDRPVTFPEVFSTLYNHLGIDGANTTVQDFQGRPQYLVDAGTKPIHELL